MSQQQKRILNFGVPSDASLPKLEAHFTFPFRLLEEKRRRLEAKRGKSGKRTLAEAVNDDDVDTLAKSAASGASRKADLNRVINKLKKSKVVQ